MLPVNPNGPIDIVNNQQQMQQMQENYFEIMAFNALNFDDLDEEEQENFIQELEDIAHDPNIVDELLVWGVDINEFLEQEEEPAPQPPEIAEQLADVLVHQMDIIDEEQNIP